MDAHDLFAPIVRTLNVGLAVVDPRDWSITYENGRFFDWFPPADDVDAGFNLRLPDLKAERALARLEAGRPFRFETESKAGDRPVPIAVELRPHPDGLAAGIVAECRDLSKQKEVEYMLESYSKMSEKHARELRKEKDRVEKLLLNIMPRSIYEEMKDYGTTTPQRFDAATILMLDFVGFTEMAVSEDPSALVAELNDIFTAFDRIVELYDCERIKTIGDAYMAVSGLPIPAEDHAHNVARVALRIKRYLERRNGAHSEPWLCRIGINTGPVVGSIVGVQKYVYDIFGPGVNLAARMESHAEPMTITLCENTYELIKDDFVCRERGEFEVRGFGTRRLYFLEAERSRER